MLSYQHRYHAGGFADLHKHLILTLVLAALRQKDSPFSYIDIHAGEGLYDLNSAEAQRTGEFASGIGRIYDSNAIPAGAVDYLRCVKAANGGGRLRLYPGSPRLALDLSRSQDILVLVERHPQAIARLRRTIGGSKRVHIHKRDALEALAALVPPRPARGIAMIDPSYEDKDEYQAVVRALGRAHAKWPQGIFLIWYPMLPAGRHEGLIAEIRESGIRNVIQTEWRERSPGSDPGLYGSGIVLVNPPWRIEGDIRSLCDWLVTMGPTGADFQIERLVEE